MRIGILMKCQSESCADLCEMEWYECARQVSQLDIINPYVFPDARRDLLAHWRGKLLKVIIVVWINCSKTFLLKPLKIIFWAFTNPAKNMYVWVGIDQAEVIVSQDFRWSSELICWKDILLVLEENLKLLSPQNQFVTDTCINTDITISATCKEMIKYIGKHNTHDHWKAESMDIMWNIL